MSSFQFILGDGIANHSLAVCQFTNEWLKNGKNRKVFIIVPNNMKFDTEMHIFHKLKELNDIQCDNYANLDVQVLSLSRLAWYLLGQTNYKQKENISSLGITLLLYNLIHQNQDQLQLFFHEIKSIEFMDSLTELFQEFLFNNITPDFLIEYVMSNLKDSDKDKVEVINKKLKTTELSVDEYLIEFTNLKFDHIESRKLHDLLVLYRLCYKQIQHYHYGELSYIDDLTEILKHNLVDLSKTRIIFMGFNTFQGKELEFIRTLTKYAASVMVDLILHPDVIKNSDSDIFFPTAMVYKQLLPSRTESDIILKKHLVNEHLKEFNDNFLRAFEGLGGEYKFEGLKDQQDIEFYQCDNTYSEITLVANQIKRLIASGQYRYKDIRIITRDIETYNIEIRPIFKKYNIPYYIGMSQSMDIHPLIIFIKQIFKIITNNYQVLDVIDFLKNNLTISLSNTQLNNVDKLENFLLKYVPSWMDFRKISLNYNNNKYNFHTIDNELQQSVELLSAYQQFINKTVERFDEQLQSANTYHDYLIHLINLLEELNISDILLEWTEEDIKEGLISDSSRHQQVWNTLMSNLDDFHNVLGDIVIDDQNTLEEFINIINLMISKSTFSQIPSTLDQVEVVDAVRQPLTKSKVSFIIGADNDHFPKLCSNDSLLTDLERQSIQKYLNDNKIKNIILNDDTYYIQQKELFFIYLSICSATEKLYISYSKQSASDNLMELSTYFKILSKSEYTGIIEQHYNYLPQNNDDIIKYIGNKQQLLSLYVLDKSTNKNQNNIWLEQLVQEEILNSNSPVSETSHKILDSVHYQNLPEQLSDRSIDILYPKSMNSSATEFETFYTCQYRHLLEKKLKLKERKIYQDVENLKLGNLYHQVFDHSLKVLAKVNSENVDKWLKQVQLDSEALLNYYGFTEEFYPSAKINYLRYSINNIIKKTAYAITSQLKLNKNWSIVGTELGFGLPSQEQKSIESIKIPVDKDITLYIKGKIDRIDLLETPNQKFLTVVDYKSSNKKFNWEDFYNGKLLQLPTYLLALDNSKTVSNKFKLAGGAYQNIHYKAMEAKELLSEFALQGIYSNSYLDAMIDQLQDEQNDLKQINNINLTKKGMIAKISQPKVLTDNVENQKDDLDIMLDYNKYLYKQAATKLHQGNLQINPTNSDDCKYCPFHSICQFDNMLEENTYRKTCKIKGKGISEMKGTLADENTQETD